LKPVEKIFQWHYANDKYMRNTANLARWRWSIPPIGHLHRRRHRFTAGDGVRAAQRVTDAQNAITSAGESAHSLRDGRRPPAGGPAYLPLPRAGAAHIAALSDKQCQQIRDFVMRAGASWRRRDLAV